MQGPELKVEELAALAKLGNLVVSRCEAEEASHKQVLDACQDLASAFLERSPDTFNETPFTCAPLSRSSLQLTSADLCMWT